MQSKQLLDMLSKTIITFLDFKYDNFRQVQGGIINTYVLLIIHCTIYLIFYCTIYGLFEMENDFFFYHYYSIDSV